MRSYSIALQMLLFTVLVSGASAQQIDSLQNIIVTVTFASPPSIFTVAKAPLRYNKSFAYSFQIDDGEKDIYSHGYPFFEGGTVAGTTFPGLKFTDGCGNDLNFKMSTSLFSFSTYGGGETDMHDPNGGYALLNVTWPELNEIYQHNWGVSNHGLTSSSSGNLSYDVARNHSYVKRKTQSATTGGIYMSIFVNPNGAEAFTPVAFAQGSLVCYREGYTLGDPSLNVNSNWNHNQIMMGRRGVGNSSNTLVSLVNAMAAASTGSARHWGVHFTHAVNNANYGYDFPTFQTVMNSVANTYGKNGLDNIWMATEEEVLDYLLIKDAITVNTQLTGSVLKITYSGTIPSSYRFYNNSLLVTADQSIASVTATGVAGKTYNGVGTHNALININWNGHYVIPPEVTAETWVSTAESTQSQLDAKVAMDYVLMVPAGAAQQAFRLRLCTIPGVTLPADFCNMRNAPITSIPAVNVCPGNQVSIPVLVNGFTNITSASLRIEYDPALITFISGSAAKPAILTGMQINSSPVGGGSTLNKIMIQWSNATPKSLSANDTLAKLVFNNALNSVPLIFNTTSGSSADCEYKDESGTVMIDFPASTYYLSGQVNFTGLPAPASITGPSSVCQGTAGHVYTVPAVTGATGYIWTYPAGFSPASGQNTNSITLEASATAVSGSITVRAVNACSSNPVSPSFPVTVKTRPVPTITGSNSLCAATPNVPYSTESGMYNYVWTISAGGSITSGATTNSILVSWNTPGTQFVGVSYTGANGCVATTPAVKTVTVNPLPNPTITGTSTGCLNSTSIFSTENGMSAYNWTVTPGGTIISGNNTSMVTVSWINTGPQTITVNYQNSNGCTASNPAVKIITVVVPPVPGINGANSACIGAVSQVYTTETGMSAYTWNISSGGFITSGAGTNAITVTWNAIGNQTVSVNYINPSGCAATSPAIKNVVVNPLPIPTVAGYDTVCVNQLSWFMTEAGMTGYQWTVGNGGTIISGAGSNLIQVSWSTVGTKVITIHYTDPNGCASAVPGLKNVVVRLLNPTITGVSTVCAGTAGVVYTTQPGMSTYSWTVTSGGVITSGAGTNSIHVTWNTPGAQSISVNYSNSFGCTAPAPGTLAVTVNVLPLPSVSGNTVACNTAVNYAYMTQPGMISYTWSISSGGVIASGQGTSEILINWTTTGAHAVNVNCTSSNGCASAVAGTLTVTVNAVPGAPGSVTGETQICKPMYGVVYSVAPVPLATGYFWNLPPGTVITNGANTPIITVNFNAGAESGEIFVICANSCGPGPFSPALPITVNPYPPDPVISLVTADTLVSSAPTGNQWYFENQVIPGATSQRQFVNNSGHYFVLVNPLGCLSDTSNIIYAMVVGVNEKLKAELIVYPNPGSGKFTIRLITDGRKKDLSIRVIDLLGKEIFSIPGQKVFGEVSRDIDLGTLAGGIYSLILQLENEQLTRKIVIEK